MGEFLRLSQAEENNAAARKDSILSDAFEAVMGAIYLEAGLDKVREILLACLSFAIRRSTLHTLKRTTKQPFKRSLKRPLASYQHTSS